MATEVASNEGGAGAEPSSAVNPAGSHPRGVLRWGYFLVLNAISAVVAIGLFVAVFYADGIDPFMRGTYDWLLAHPGVTSVMAFSPLAASLLVGWGYSQRARKRKAAAAKAARAEVLDAASVTMEPRAAPDPSAGEPRPTAAV